MIRRVVSFALHQPLFIAADDCSCSSPAASSPSVAADRSVSRCLRHPGQRHHALSGPRREEVEKQVTIPLEIALAGCRTAVRMFSHTQFGLSFIVLTFDDKVNDYFARQQVLERLQTADLPTGVTAAARAALHGHRRDLSLSAERRRDDADRICARSRTGWSSDSCSMMPGVADIVTHRRPHQAVRGQSRPGEAALLRRHAAATLTALGRGNANAGGSYVEQGTAAVPHSRHRAAPRGGRHRQHRRRVARRHAGSRQGRGARDRRRGAAPGHRRPGQRRRHRHRHRADAQGRESVRWCSRRSKKGRTR